MGYGSWSNVKKVSHVLTFILFLVGVGTVVAASLTIQYCHEFDVFLNGILKVPIFALVVGLGLFLMVLLELFWTREENFAKWNTYACISLGVLEVALTVFGAFFYVYYDEAEVTITDSVESAMSRYGLGDNNSDTLLDVAQQKLSCCGVLNYTDWNHFNYSGVADGCCMNMTKDCGVDYFINPSPPDIFEIGCYTVLINELDPYSWSLAILIPLAWLFFQLMLMNLSFACNKSTMQS